MRTIRVILFSSLLLFSVVAAAQNSPFTFGVKAGANLSNFSGKGVDNPEVRFGFNVGVTVDYSITENIFLSSGLEYTSKGTKVNYMDIDLENGASEVIGVGKFSANYLQLPLHVGYRLPVTDAFKLNFHAGPYIAYGVGGKLKISNIILSEYDDIEKEHDTFSDLTLKKFDFGLGLGVGAEFGKINVGLGYDLGLLNISQIDIDGYPIRTQNAYLTVGYKF